MEKARIGIIGGSGVYEIDELKIIDELDIKTPFGQPSDKMLIGKFGDGENIAFLPRHGKGHCILPTEVNSKANMWAMKYLGVEHIIGISAIGSLKKEIQRGDLILPDQIIDRTKSRPNSFFGDGIVGHVAFAEPFCNSLRNTLLKEINNLGYKVHKNGTYVCMEGPLFSTKAESHLYRDWNASIIGMTALPEAKLAREAEICYALIALSTDYDCWLETEESVSVEMILDIMKENSVKAKNIIKNVVYNIPDERNCECGTAAKYAILTNKKYIPAKTLKRLELLYGKYFK